MKRSVKPTFTNIIQKGASVPAIRAVPTRQILGGASVPKIQQIGGGSEKNSNTADCGTSKTTPEKK